MQNFLQGSVVDVVGALVVGVFVTGNGCWVEGIRNVAGACVIGIAVTVQRIICITTVLHKFNVKLICICFILTICFRI